MIQLATVALSYLLGGVVCVGLNCGLSNEQPDSFSTLIFLFWPGWVIVMFFGAAFCVSAAIGDMVRKGWVWE